MRTFITILAFATLIGFFAGASNWAYDRSEAEYCSGCHINPNMQFVVDNWFNSNHAESFNGFNGNTYCAECHTPIQADPHNELAHFMVGQFIMPVRLVGRRSHMNPYRPG